MSLSNINRFGGGLPHRLNDMLHVYELSYWQIGELWLGT